MSFSLFFDASQQEYRPVDITKVKTTAEDRPASACYKQEHHGHRPVARPVADPRGLHGLKQKPTVYKKGRPALADRPFPYGGFRYIQTANQT